MEQKDPSPASQQAFEGPGSVEAGSRWRLKELLIADGRPANARRAGGIPLDVHLPIPEDFAALHVPPCSRLIVVKY